MRTYVAIAAAAISLSSCANMLGPQPRDTAPRAQVQASPEVRNAQARLQTLGFYNGRVDGLYGPETASAVERFQRYHGLSTTGRLDQTTAVALRDATRPEPVNVASAEDVRAIQDRLAEFGYYRGPVDGVWGADTQAGLERFQRSRNLDVGGLTRPTVIAMDLDPDAISRPGTRTAESAGTRESSSAGRTPARETGAYPLQPRVVRNVQQKLRDQGFYEGSVDGVWGPSTRSALQEFQNSRGLEATGDLTPATASMLGFDPNNLLASARR